MPSGKHLLLVTLGREPAAQERRLLALAEVMGVPARTVAVEAGQLLSQQVIDEYRPGELTMAMSAATLAAASQGSGPGLEKLFNGILSELLVFACTGAPEEQLALRTLSAGEVSTVVPLEVERQSFFIPLESSPYCRQLAGLGFSGGYQEPAFAFHPARPADRILTANGRPVFVCFMRGSAQVFLLGGPLPSVAQPVRAEDGIESHYAGLTPPLIFLRHCFPESCWHSPQSTARLIVDDPLLAMRYGLLEFEKLQASMQRNRYGTTIAFIPWNAWRTTRQNAKQILGQDSNLSICIHGCDHTNHEFQSLDEGLLDAKAALAMARMEAQQTRTGAPFEPVMVFPQGRFSAPAIQALRANHYLAAVNTTVFPAGPETAEIALGDLLRPAVTRFSGFPIFPRHYPRNPFDSAFDLFLGKPALLVEHHHFFGAGFEAMEAIAAGLYKVEPSLSWPSLSGQLTRCCLQRVLPSGETDVMFFTRRFLLENREGRGDRFLLEKHEPDAELIAGVTVDGAATPYSIENGTLRLEVQAQPGEHRVIEIVDRERARRRPSSLGMAYNARVLLRRGLSEFRDNTLARHEGLLKAANGIARVLGVTGDRR